MRQKGVMKMEILKKIISPTEVFVPRSADFVEKVYIPRENLEKQLIRAIEGTKNILIKGQSGCGKTWLYKKVFKDLHIKYLIVDLSDAAVKGGCIEDAINKSIIEYKVKYFNEESYKEQKAAGVSAGVANANLVTEHIYTKVESALSAAFDYLKCKGNKKSVLVLDNLEHISDSDETLKELNAILMKVDNKDFTKYNVKVLVVGTPVGVDKFYRNTSHMETIGNRIEEIDEVKGLSKKEEVEMFLKKTFINQLGIDFDTKNLSKYAKYILEITSGIPQRLHEYCLSLYYAIEDEGGNTEFKVHKIADKEYLRKSFQKYSTIIQKSMNSYETSEQRRNQVIYCLPKLKRMLFSTAEMETEVRK